jgi:IrrE N-terminal-like domain
VIDFADFMDRFDSGVWCDLDERPKLRQALEALYKRMPVEVYDELPDIIIFAPAPWKNAAGFPIPKSTDTEGAVIYLSPRMEEEMQEQNDFTVAHEFAHVSLRHHTFNAMGLPSCVEYLDQPNEVAADALVKQWGYEIPAYRTKSAGSP